jgi:ribonuclease HI
MSKLKQYRVYTDGSYRLPNCGSYASIIINDKNEETVIQKGAYNTTNNRMELKAVLVALESIEASSTICVYTDSQYVAHSMSKWLRMWHHYDYVTSTGQPVKNIDLMKRLYIQITKHKVKVVWIKGHNGDHYNEKCDSLAQIITLQMKGSVYTGELDEP